MENQAQVTESVGGEMPATEQPQLSVSDLQNLRTVLDIASRRGAFGANEMTAVGQVFDKLDKFLNAIAPAPTQQAEETPAN